MLEPLVINIEWGWYLQRVIHIPRLTDLSELSIFVFPWAAEGAWLLSFYRAIFRHEEFQPKGLPKSAWSLWKWDPESQASALYHWAICDRPVICIKKDLKAVEPRRKLGYIFLWFLFVVSLWIGRELNLCLKGAQSPTSDGKATWGTAGGDG